MFGQKLCPSGIYPYVFINDNKLPWGISRATMDSLQIKNFSLLVMNLMVAQMWKKTKGL